MMAMVCRMRRKRRSSTVDSGRTPVWLSSFIRDLSLNIIRYWQNNAVMMSNHMVMQKLGAYLNHHFRTTHAMSSSHRIIHKDVWISKVLSHSVHVANVRVSIVPNIHGLPINAPIATQYCPNRVLKIIFLWVNRVQWNRIKRDLMNCRTLFRFLFKRKKRTIMISLLWPR